MKIAMINGSPKNKDSASGELLKELQSYFTNGAICDLSEYLSKTTHFNRTTQG